MIVMRWLLGLLVMLLATGAGAQATERVLKGRVYAEVASADVSMWIFEASNERVCALSMQRGWVRLRLSWARGSDISLMVLSSNSWRFPDGMKETPVEVWLDERKLGRAMDGRPLPHIMMAASGNMLRYHWAEGVAEALENVATIRFRFGEGIYPETRFETPAMRILLLGLKECRAELDR
jgi:hypothetical protein